MGEELIVTSERASVGQIERARREGTLLPPGAAQALRELADSSAARGAVRRITTKSTPWLVQLNPSEAAQTGLKSGALEFTKTKEGGRVLAQVRDAKTKSIVENVDWSPKAAPGKNLQAAKVASAGAAVAWQAMAIATQQHYLVEISGKLSRIEAGVAELIGRAIAEKAATLSATIEALDLVERHLAEGSPLSDNDRQSVTQWHKDATAIAEAAVSDARRILGDPEGEPKDALEDLALADQAVAVATRCAAALLRMDYETEAKRLTEFWHYAEAAERLLGRVNAVMRKLDDRLRVSRAEWAWHERTRPSGKPQQLWNKTGGRIKPARVGAPEPKFLGDRGFTDEERTWIAEWARLTPAPALIGATVVIDEAGARLLPPAL